MKEHICKTCECLVKGICRSDAPTVDPRGECPAWIERDTEQPLTPARAAILEAVAMLLRAYPKLWYQECDTISKSLTRLRKPDPRYQSIARELSSLRKWIPSKQRRTFDATLRRAGA